MSHSRLISTESLTARQNEYLYRGVRYSCIGTMAASVVLALTLYTEVNKTALLLWTLMTIGLYGLRWLDSCAFFKAIADNKPVDVYMWRRRFMVGVIGAGLAWGSSIWLLYPESQGYQVLLVLAMVAIAGSAIASIPFDTRAMCTFQIIIILAVQSRLILSGDPFALKVALATMVFFAFAVTCGLEVSRNYAKQSKLQQDSENRNLSLIRITEQVAKIGYWRWDTHSETIELSEHLAEMWGLSDTSVNIADWMDLVHIDDVSGLKKVLASDHGASGESAIEFRMVGAGQNLYRDMYQITKCVVDSTGSHFLMGTIQDISAIKSAEKKIYRMAFFDDLTGLCNRGHFHEQLKTQVAVAQRFEKKLALVYIDLDDFKEVNDSFGHEVGDNYLRIFADFLKTTVRNSDVTARLGGDEFCVVLTGVRNQEEVKQVCEKMFELSNKVIEIGSHRIQPKLSVGLSMFPEDGTEADVLLKAADIAMFSVKQSGKHGYKFFESRMQSETAARIQLEAAIRQAIDKDQFELWYQPKVDIRINRITGVEALIRWRHPEKGLIPPDVFITTAERVGMINEIGDWVIETACAQLSQWTEQGLELDMAVNIAGGHFISEGFCDHVKKCVAKHKLLPSVVEIEITESMTRDPEEHSRICHQLRRAGVRIAIDDFGTGYSSLSVLDKLEVDTLKIDKSFIEGLPDDHSSELLVRAIMELSLGLGYDVVAEGVENEAQLLHLHELNCPFVQGYLFSKPLPAAEIPAAVYALCHGSERAA